MSRFFEHRGGRSPLIIKDLGLFPQRPTNTPSDTLDYEELLGPNRGSSVKDQLDRIERSFDEHGAQLLQIARRVDTLDDHARDAHREIYPWLSKLEK